MGTNSKFNKMKPLFFPILLLAGQVFFSLLLSSCHPRAYIQRYVDSSGKEFTVTEMMEKFRADTLKPKGVEFDAPLVEGNTSTTTFRFRYGPTKFVSRHLNNVFPTFMLKDKNDQPVSLDSLRGNWVVLYMWSPECYPSMIQIPSLNDLQDKYRNRVKFISMAREPYKHLKKASTGFNPAITIIGNADAYFEGLGLRGVPKSVVLDSNGRAINIIEGGPVSPSNKLFRVLDSVFSMQTSLGLIH